MKRPSANSQGFTLIEVVVTIIVSAILAVLLMQVMSGHITRSYWPLEKMDQALALREAMEIANTEYRRLLTTHLKPLEELQDRIADGTYWSGKPYGAEIKVDNNFCIDLDKIAETGERECSHPDETLLKVTLSYEEQSLTTLFSR